MKATTLLLSSALFTLSFSGCGESSASDTSQDTVQTTGTQDENTTSTDTNTTDDTNTSEDNTTVTFPTEGTYDLSLYTIPQTTITQKVYMTTLYTNDTNNFDDDYGDLNTTEPVFESISTDSGTTTFSSDALYNYDLTVLDDRIQYDDGENNPIDMLRFGDLGTVLLTDTLHLDATTHINSTCAISALHDSYNSFSNVIQIDCSDPANLFRYTGFFAENVGLVSDVTTICTTPNNCTNTVRSYTILN